MPSRSNFNSTKSAQRIILKIRSSSQVSSYLKTLPIMPIDMPLKYHILVLYENRRSRGILDFKQPMLQNKVQLCCTLYQRFLDIVAAGGLRMSTNECSKGGELLATVQLSNSSPNLHHTRPTHIQTSKLCLPLYSFKHQTKDLLFYKPHRCLRICLKTGFQTFVICPLLNVFYFWSYLSNWGGGGSHDFS